MSLNIDNKIYRNMQEQVAHNASNIRKLAEAIDGISLEDKLIIISVNSGTLNAQEMAIASKEFAFIYNSSTKKVYYKSSTDSTYHFTSIEIQIPSTAGGGYSVKQEAIGVNILTGNFSTYTAVNQTFYNKNEVDSLLALKATTDYVNTELAKKANLTGANFTGPITAPSIIENMSGYVFNKSVYTDFIHNPIYASVVKTGNKVTFVVFSRISRTANLNANFVNLGGFIIPAAVGEKLFPFTIGTINTALDVRILTAYSGLNTKKDIHAYITKQSNNNIIFAISSALDLTAETEYLIRYEATFLLSENLAS